MEAVDTVYRENMSLPEEKFKAVPTQTIDLDKILREDRGQIKIWRTTKSSMFYQGARVLIRNS